MRTTLIITLLLITLHIYAQHEIKDHYVLMSDGDSLATDIYLPEKEGQYPVILMRTPYDKSQRQFGDYLNKHGYIFIVQDVRGRSKSSGTFKAWIDEELDGLETLQWIDDQTWSNGNIGLLGSSYSGYSAMQLAGSKHPSLKAIVNNSGPSNLYDVIFPGGVFHATALMPWTLAFSHNNSMYFPPYPSGKSMGQLARELPLNKVFEENHYEGQFWNYVIRHQTEDAYWQQLNIRNVEEIEIPILHITGWYDFIATSAIDGYQHIVEAQKVKGMKPNQELWIGPWIHDAMMNGGTVTGEVDFGEDVKVGLKAFLDESINYFDQYLKEKSDSKRNTSAIRYFETHSNKWKEAKTWPETNDQTFYLSINSEAGTLSKEVPTYEGKANFQHDPAKPIETNGGANIHFPFFGDTNGIQTQYTNDDGTSLYFTTTSSKEDQHIFGKVKATLYVSKMAEDADLAIKLNLIEADGKVTNIVDGIQRISLNEDKQVRQFTQPGIPTEVHVDLGYISTKISKGSKLQVQVSGSNYPKFALNPGTKANALTAEDFLRYEQNIHFSKKFRNRINIPMISTGKPLLGSH